MIILNKIKKKIRRHPLLYFTRYAFVSKNGMYQYTEDMCRFDEFHTAASVPDYFFKINQKIPLDPHSDELEMAKQIGVYLRNACKPGPAIGLSPENTLKKMLHGEGGVCSDFSEIFNLFCLINNIKVKEWGCIDKFYKSKYGHSFNEIYSSALKKWVAIDIHKGILFTDENKKYLSGIELFKYLRAGNPLIVQQYSDYSSPMPDRLNLIYSSSSIPFLIDNKNYDYVSNYMRKHEHKYYKLLIDTWVFLKKKNPKFIFVLDNYKELLFQKSKKIHLVTTNKS